MEVLIDGVKYVPIPDVPTDKGLLAALEVRFNSDAGDNLTVRDYLRTLLIQGAKSAVMTAHKLSDRISQ